MVLLRNERQEWELPGGRLEPGEQPPACLEREIREELGLEARARTILDSWLYPVLPGREVVIVTYGCVADAPGVPVHSHEHSEVGLFAPPMLSCLPMPEGYRDSVRRWLDILHATDG